MGWCASDAFPAPRQLQAVTTDELKTLFGEPINPKWVFVLIGDRLFGRTDKDTWHEYESER
jgi:hypothetical protein